MSLPLISRKAIEGMSAPALSPSATHHDQLTASTSLPPSLKKRSGWRSKRARRSAAPLDVRHFMRALRITSTDMLRQIESASRHSVGTDTARVGKCGTFHRAPPPRGTFQPLKHLVKHEAASRNPGLDVTGQRSIATREARGRFRRSRRASCSRRHRPTRSSPCATAPFSPSACCKSSDSTARRSPP
jgi:hypothetical protein